ncbi:MAG: energy-coupling factor ABC transporter permease [Moraxella osloensis]|nr:energy-coupling factor ABC transporter permease [Moraxella osloensis]
MNIPQDVLPWLLSLSGWLVYGLLMLYIIRRAPWFKVMHDRHAQTVFFVAVILLMLLWRFDATIAPGLSFHFLGATIITLMFGHQFAMMALSLALLGVTLDGETGWDAFGINILFMGALPVYTTWFAWVLAQKYLSKHFFVYTFINSFLVGGLSMAVTILGLSVVLVWGDVQEWYKVQHEFLALLPMMAAPEAFINGFVMTVLVAFKPEWLATFSDRDYLHGK